jgi:LysM repeat protein
VADLETALSGSLLGEEWAERLTQTAHLGVVLAEQPEVEFGFYALQILGLYDSAPIAPAARKVLAAFVQQGPAPRTEDPFVHCTVEGDSLERLAERFGTRVEAILRTNPRLGGPSLLSPGMRLQIPHNRVYVACEADALEGVARELTDYVQCFDPDLTVTVEELCRRNGLVTEAPLVRGQVLAFPFPEFE